MPAPLILTLRMDERAFAYLDGLRRRHFPPERNLIPAHLTLFHKLPGEEEDAITADLAGACRDTAPMLLTVGGLRSLGRGVALTVQPGGLDGVRRRLALSWAAWLGAQDRQRFQPHVTLQNKVAPDQARTLMADLAAGFAPFTITGQGFLLWRYLGGPWDLVGDYSFTARASRDRSLT